MKKKEKIKKYSKQEHESFDTIHKITLDFVSYYMITLDLGLTRRLIESYNTGKLNTPDERGNYVRTVCYAYIGEALSSGIEEIYNKFINYPFISEVEVHAVYGIIEIWMKQVIKDKTKKIEKYVEESIEEGQIYKPVYEGLFMQAGGILKIKDKQLTEAYYTEKHKNRPIILSGVYGIVGSLLGAVIGALATLYAAGIIK